jgi:beta-phosphoglucomutase-like phosphatase (HAD superfamily)
MESKGKIKNGKIVLFDFDGVIVDSFKPAFEVQKMIRPGINFSEDDYRKFFEGNVFNEQ